MVRRTDWYTILFGIPLIFILLCTQAFIKWMRWNHFIPSNEWSFWRYFVVSVASVAVTFFSSKVNLLKPKISYYSISLLLSGLLIFGTVTVLSKTVTTMFGTHHQETFRLFKVYNRSAPSKCEYALTGWALNHMTKQICITKQAYDILPAGPVLITLEGKITPLGFSIQAIHENNN